MSQGVFVVAGLVLELPKGALKKSVHDTCGHYFFKDDLKSQLLKLEKNFKILEKTLTHTVS